MSGPRATLLADGRRLHLNHGPIDLIVEGFGAAVEVSAAYRQARARFQTILEELVAELPRLREPAMVEPRRLTGPTARRMEAAVAPLAQAFITPMAAVAGAVADEVLAALTARRRLRKAYVNNGGDCAFWLTDGEVIAAAIAGTAGGVADRIGVRAEDRARGLATSGWRGRSFSLGIADAVTVVAASGAEADAAATVIANAVDLPGHPNVLRVPACRLAPDSDLGARPVTQGVGKLSGAEIDAALDAGASEAEALLGRGLIKGAALFLAEGVRIVGMVNGEGGAMGSVFQGRPPPAGIGNLQITLPSEPKR